ncbi:MAG TPA: prolyl oligopeptidase family serine peptidase [Kofleriaceae bacterium]|nr:prolyl oligopeptidase family serine peptidase [Kofleriaceae bacterium]
MAIIALAAGAGSARADGYDKPPKPILDVMTAALPPEPLVSPTGDRILLVSWVEYPSIAQVAEPFLRLAGARVEPRTRHQHNTPAGYDLTPCARSLRVVEVATGREAPVSLPAGCAELPLWSADGAHFAFASTTADAVELWLGDAASGAVHRVPGVKLNPMLEDPVQWLADQRTLLVKLVPAQPGPPPQAATAIVGPGIQETDGRSGQSSTYEARDLLTNKYDEALFAYYGTSQLALVDTATGAVTPLGAPAVYGHVAAAPDGDHVLVHRLTAPFSYAVTYRRFAHTVEVWDRHGASRVLAKLPAAERVPIHGVPTGPRDHEWRPTEPATLVWTEALDGGDWNVSVPARDKLMAQRAPFTQPAVELVRTEQRLNDTAWSEQRHVALLQEFDENRHWVRGFLFDADAPAHKPRLVWDLSSDERYKAPGVPVERVLGNGQRVMRQDGDVIYLRGLGSSPDGDRPFLDQLDTKTLTTTRLFRSERTAYERFLAFTGADPRTFLTWHETPADPPNAMLRTLTTPPIAAPPAGEAMIASSRKPVTHIPDPTPVLRQIKKRLVRYKRKDGVELSFTLYTPPGYREGTRLPAILNAYPLDFASAEAAAQVAGSDQRFERLFGYRLLLLAGYAIIDRASFPIVGDPKRAYDTYLDQLLEDARAAVDKAVELGVVDRDRIGVTGHSHGALMTANLIAHSDLFRAGVATSGAYNKMLTPFGFQSERRSVWAALDVYTKVSPFYVADRIKLPLLLMHGTDDANPGTVPLQSVQLYEALRGNGGTARLVMLPHEPHHYTALETNEQVAYEELRWFDRYVKNAAARTAKPAPAKTTATR